MREGGDLPLLDRRRFLFGYRRFMLVARARYSQTRIGNSESTPKLRRYQLAQGTL
jgi:hypothetical protein